MALLRNKDGKNLFLVGSYNSFFTAFSLNNATNLWEILESVQSETTLPIPQIIF